MTLRSNILRAASAVVIAAILATVGGFASPSSAATERVGSAELQAAYTKSNKVILATGVVYSPPAVLGGFMNYKMVFAPKSTLSPGNVGASVETMGIKTAVVYSMEADNPLSVGGLGETSIFDSSFSQIIWPDEEGFVLGEVDKFGRTLDEYTVSKPDSSTIEVHMSYIEPGQPDEEGNPAVLTTDSVFTITDGLITRAERTSANANSLLSGDGASTFDYSAAGINREWSALLASWKSTHFDSSTSALATKLTKAYVTSEAAARKYGVTISQPWSSKASGAIATYDASKKKSVIVIFDAKKKPSKVTFSDAPATISGMWANVLGVDYFKSKAIKYTAKTRTYDLKGQSGSVAKIKLDTKGRIISTSVSGGLLPESRTISYAPSKTTIATWGGFGTKGQALIAWLQGLLETFKTGKLTYTKKGTVITAKRTTGSSDFVTFDTKGMKATDVTKVFGLLGLKLGK